MEPNDRTKLIAAALELGEQYPVFPCRENKKPVGKWKEMATQDPELIELNFSVKGAALVGVPMGGITGLVTIDCDTPEAVKWVQDKGMAQTLTHRTQRAGGVHYIFKCYAAATVRNATDAEGIPGLDVRGEGGYIIWWPATSPGGAVVDDEPAMWQPGDFPKHLRSTVDITPPIPGAGWIIPAAPDPERVQVGSRTSYLVREVGLMVTDSLDTQDIINRVVDLNKAMPEPLSLDELRAMDCAAIVVMHATKGGQDRPSSIRGSTQALATADTVIQMRSPVKKEKDDMQLDGKEVVIEFVKARLGKMPDNIVAEVLRSPDEVLRLSAIVV